MFTTYSHLKAEDNYRREALRDQNQTTGGGVGKAVAALVVAGTLVLAACGTVTESEPVPEAPSVNDIAPVGQPNAEALDRALSTQEAANSVLTIEFGGKIAPSWQPNWDAGPTGHDAGSSVRDVEPLGTPNYGLIETIVGAQPNHGPR